MEISTKLYPRSVFLAGETVRCLIKFHYPKTTAEDENKAINVAWASVQLQCECLMDENSTDPTTAATTSTGRTSLRPVDWAEGAQIITSSPKLLFCELILEEGQSKSFSYADKLPLDIPPSYRGKSIKFNYNLLVGTQLLNASVQVMKVPFRVLNNNNFNHLQVLDHDGNEDVMGAISNPFQIGNKFEANSSSDVSLGQHNGSLLRRQSSLGPPPLPNGDCMFDITVASGHIAKLSMTKKCFKMGEEIVACLQFPRGKAGFNVVECVQYSVSLVCEEDIYAEERKLAKRSRVKIAKSQDFTIGFEESCLRLEIPLHSTPSFNASLCSLSWHLHFEFVVVNPALRQSSLEMCNEDGCEWNAPQKLNVQTLEWNLPITIYPADPAQVEWLKRNSKPAMQKWHVKLTPASNE